MLIIIYASWYIDIGTCLPGSRRGYYTKTGSEDSIPPWTENENVVDFMKKIISDHDIGFTYGN